MKEEEIKERKREREEDTNEFLTMIFKIKMIHFSSEHLRFAIVFQFWLIKIFVVAFTFLVAHQRHRPCLIK